ncbi:DNA polymerase III subunit delta' [Nitrosophilus kaiyonis]|uniref:DNA polymerase III subunit delta' n=1 Tax=Nitrosophilus kaiyonis TaxID=2930200 RepID=UPI0024931AFA|nr:DNA polymerase III subunit delta' [Nitrosophilus kaiyonis]
MIELKSQIVISDDFEEIKEYLKERINPQYLHIIENDEFKVEDSKEAVKEAYLASENEKFIALIANRFNIYSQNALLKILEEPPKNINFIIVTKSKSALLPTIRSRLPVTNIKKNISKEIDIDIKNIDLKYVYDFLQKNRKLEKTEAKNIIENLLKKAIEADLKLKESEIDQFSNSIKLIELNSNISNVLTTLFLIILDAKRR